MKKKIIFVFGAILLGITPPPAAASSDRCISLTIKRCESYKFYPGYDGLEPRSDWFVRCTAVGGIDFGIMGISACFNKTSSSGYIELQPFDENDTSADLIGCWCKMLSPRETAWFYAESTSNPGNCQVNCNKICAHMFELDNGFYEYLMTSDQVF